MDEPNEEDLSKDGPTSKLRFRLRPLGSSSVQLSSRVSSKFPPSIVVHRWFFLAWTGTPRLATRCELSTFFPRRFPRIRLVRIRVVEADPPLLPLLEKRLEEVKDCSGEPGKEIFDTDPS